MAGVLKHFGLELPVFISEALTIDSWSGDWNQREAHP